MKKFSYLCYFCYLILSIFFIIAIWWFSIVVDEGISIEYSKQTIMHMKHDISILEKIIFLLNDKDNNNLFKKIESKFNTHILHSEGEFYCIDDLCLKIINDSIQEIKSYSDIPIDY